MVTNIFNSSFISQCYKFNHGNPEVWNMIFAWKILLNSYFFVIFLTMRYIKETYFLVWVSTKNRVFQWAGPIFLKSDFIAPRESQCYQTMLILSGDYSWTCQSPRHYVHNELRWRKRHKLQWIVLNDTRHHFHLESVAPINSSPGRCSEGCWQRRRTWHHGGRQSCRRRGGRRSASTVRSREGRGRGPAGWPAR